jgi:deoxyribonuclease-4
MEKLLFGTGGVPRSSRPKTTVDGIKRIAELGLGCMEIEFVQGVKMGEAAARQVAETAAREGIKLSAHGPYYINLNAHEPEKIKASQDRLLQTARIGAICGAESAVFHTAFYLGDSPEQAYNNIKKNLSEVINQLQHENNRICLRPEVMGKHTEFGTLEEIFRLCTELEGVAPAIDLAHWHARTEKFNSFPEFDSVLKQVRQRLGRSALENMHFHLSGIAYSKKGEVKHLDLTESDFQYGECLKALKANDVRGLVICESPNLEEDALLLQSTYNSFE